MSTAQSLSVEELDALYKFLALKISDRVSSQLKLSFDMKDVTVSQQPFKELQAQLSSFCYAGIMSYFSRGVVLFVDPRIIYMLSNRMLGGPGIIEDKPSPYFTNSEHVFGDQLMNWFQAFYQEHHLPFKFLRAEENVSLVHYFYPDEPVIGAVMNCKINEKSVGSIVVVHPLSAG